MKSKTNLLCSFLYFSLLSQGWSFTTNLQKINIKGLYSTSTPSDRGSVETTSYEIRKKNHILCPPLPLQSLPLGKVIYPLQALPDLSITRLAVDPNLFLLKNFLSSPEEQISMIMTAMNQGMDYSGTRTGDVVSQRFKSYTTWVYPEEDQPGSEKELESEINGSNADVDDHFQYDGGKIARYMTELSSFLFFPEYFSRHDSDGKSNDCIAEAVQVVRYEVGGKYDMHHDGYNRFLTVLCYLNGVAGTWFPYAKIEREEDDNNESFVDIPNFTMDTVAEDKVPGKDGLLIVGGMDYDDDDVTGNNNPHIVKIYPGDAIAFYSYDWIETDEKVVNTTCFRSKDSPPPTGPFMNYRSLHTGMTAEKEEKWIATNWFRMNVEG